jgi:ABC-2 type transport system permease protein
MQSEQSVGLVDLDRASSGRVMSESTPVQRAVAAMPMERVSYRRKFWTGWVSEYRAIWGYRELLLQLVRKELKVKYKESVLGFFWTMARPMLQIVIYYVAFQIFLRNGQPDYAVFIFSGLIIWGLFTDIVGGATGTIVGNSSLIKKTYFPRELFVLAVVGASLVNFFFQACVLVLVIAISWLYGAHVHFDSDLLLVPPALIVCLLFATALGLVLAAYTVYLRDLQHLIDVILLAGFWMVPVVYSVTQPMAGLGKSHPRLLDIYLANPLLSVVASFQRAFYTVDDKYLFQGDLWSRLAVSTVVGIVLVWIGQRLFVKAQGNFAQEL